MWSNTQIAWGTSWVEFSKFEDIQGFSKGQQFDHFRQQRLERISRLQPFGNEVSLGPRKDSYVAVRQPTAEAVYLAEIFSPGCNDPGNPTLVVAYSNVVKT